MKCPVGLFLLSVVCLHAEASPPVAATVIGLSGNTAKKSLPEVDVFSGQSPELDIVLEAPLGSKLALHADVLQVSSGIAAPISSGIKLGEAIDFTKQPRQIIRATIPVPEVQRKTEFRVRLLAHATGHAGSSLAGEFRLLVYLQDDFGELRDLFSTREDEPQVQLNVFGPGRSIRAFLTDHKIPFEESGEEIPSQFRSGVVYIGEGESKEIIEQITRTHRARIILFTQQNGELPGIYRMISPQGSITKITLPILGNLATNPLSQKTFVEALSQSVNQPLN